MPEEPSTLRERLADRTDRVLADLRSTWGEHDRVEPFTYHARDHDPDEAPATVEDQLAVIAGIASVVTFYDEERRETVLVYKPGGGWEPPGGAVEADETPAAAARKEAREETGLSVALDDLLYAGRFRFEYPDGTRLPLPVAAFVGHRVDGTLSVEREGTAHPGVCRGTGLFERGSLPPLRRDGELIRGLLGDPPAWDGENPHGD